MKSHAHNRATPPGCNPDRKQLPSGDHAGISGCCMRSCGVDSVQFLYRQGAVPLQTASRWVSMARSHNKHVFKEAVR